MIDGERRVATMPQVLSLWNSHAVAMVIDDGSLLKETIAANDSRLTLDIIFLAILARAPTASDRALIDHHVAQSQKPLNGVNDVIWALLNTREFLFVQ